MGACALALLASWVAPGRPTPEYEVKAAFLHNFVVLSRWPARAFDGADAPIVVAVVGRDPFGPLLERALEGRRAHGRAIVLRRHAKPEDLKPCHVLFVSRALAGDLEPVLSRTRGQPTLLVGEQPDFARLGGTFNLVVADHVVRFEVNLRRAREAGVELSSKLLRLAHEVIEP